ncbi:MAG TPA: TRAM domain-containing protein [Candidatus Nanoarchaeia archaeon]|nr:TRAM domain-containing protein [Candidatus Nanoarchaeia archaeon]
MRSFNSGFESQDGGYGNRNRGGSGGFGMRRSFAPVKVGEEIDLKIESVGEKGDGIAKVKGFIVFVPNTKQGEERKVKITRVLNKCAFGEAVGDATGSTSGSSESSGSTEAECDDEKGVCTPAKLAGDDGDEDGNDSGDGDSGDDDTDNTDSGTDEGSDDY